MKVTAQVKQRTKERIVAAARKLFVEKSFARTTTRDLASAAQIAAGTLFNYFPTKEALAFLLFAEAQRLAQTDYDRLRRGDEALVEDLFLWLACTLRRLEPYRAFVGQVVETALSPGSRQSAVEEAESFRLGHMRRVGELLALRDCDATASFVATHLYWTLFVGLLAFWSRDESPGQEDTLVLGDRSIRLFAASQNSNSAAMGGQR